MSRLSRHIDNDYLSASRRFYRGEKGVHVVMVYVEGYDDIAFWRGIFNRYETEKLRFEISVPARDDLAKGKRVLLGMVRGCGPHLVVCMDSDFDYLFQDRTAQSRLVNRSPYLFQTYTYSIENYTCYPPSLRSTCVRATKNDTFIFDFPRFMDEFSQIVHPLFLWYAYSALNSQESAFTLNDFRNAVKLHYTVVEDNGRKTLEWLERQVERRLRTLRERHPHWTGRVKAFGEELRKLGVNEHNVYLYMHGHTLQDNVVTTVVGAVCEELRELSLRTIRNSTRAGITLTNELSNYKNSLRDIRNLLKDNTEYRDSEPFKRLEEDIRRFVRSLTADPEAEAEERLLKKGGGSDLLAPGKRAAFKK